MLLDAQKNEHLNIGLCFLTKSFSMICEISATCQMKTIKSNESTDTKYCLGFAKYCGNPKTSMVWCPAITRQEAKDNAWFSH